MSDTIETPNVRDALILAAEFFFSDPVQESDEPLDPSLKILGTPIIVRCLRQLQDAGVTRSFVVLPVRFREIETLVKADARISHEVRFAFTSIHELSEAVKQQCETIEGEAFLCRHDLIAPPKLLQHLAAKPLRQGIRLAARDLSRRAGQRRLEHKTEGGWRLSDLDAPFPPLVGAGILSASAIERLRENGDLAELTGTLNREDKVEAFEADAYWSQTASQRSDIPEAEHKLLESLKKPIDGIIARTINRRISLPMSRVLAKYTPITPNQATLITLLLAIVAIWMAAKGGYVWMLLGALVLQFASIVDGVDGELARLKYKSSKIGEWMDTVIDDISNYGFLCAVVYAVYTTPADPGWLLIPGWLTVVLYPVQTILMYTIIIRFTDSGDVMAIGFDFDKADRFENRRLSVRLLGALRYVVKRDFYIFLLLMFALFGVLPYFLPFSALSLIIAISVTAKEYKQKSGSSVASEDGAVEASASVAGDETPTPDTSTQNDAEK